jgi:HEPN domain-containing protein
MPLSLRSLGLAHEWLTYARSDLLLADINPPEGVMLDALCYHAQQAAEKALKAILVAYEVDFPPTHNLAILRDLVEDACELPVSLQSVVELSVYAVSSRYPEDAESVMDQAEVDAAIIKAREVFEYAEKHIRQLQETITPNS